MAKGSLRRRLLLTSVAVFSAILLVEGAALVSLEYLDGQLSRLQAESIADGRRMLAITETTSDLTIAARRFHEVADREALYQAEADLRGQMQRFSAQIPSLTSPGKTTPAPFVAADIIAEANRLEGIIEHLAATAAEAIDAHAGMRTDAQDLEFIKSELMPQATGRPMIAVALTLASTALASTDRADVEGQRDAYIRLLDDNDRPMALSLLTSLFDRRLAVIDVETRQRFLVAAAETATREITALAREYTRLLDHANLARQETTRRLLLLGKIAALALGLVALAAAFVVANVSVRGAVRDLAGIAEAMRRLAAGDPTAEAPGSGRRDEIGALANAFSVFKAQMMEREEMRRRLTEAERLEAIGRFTGGVAHDFNNVLTVISSNLQLIQETTDPESLNGKRVLKALEAAEGSASMVQQLLTFGHRRALDPVPTDINAVIASLVDLLEDSFGDAIALEVERPPGEGEAPLIALVDPGQLENALINLLFNARDAIGEEGKIRIFAGTLPTGDIRIRITDDGAGMSPEVLTHVFEPFFTTKSGSSGHGLGLSTVYGFIRQSGGDIKLRSTAGAGTTVEIRLPHYSGHQAAT
ncbi:sensor histidine kinase [Martelella sp. AMO21009]